MIEIKKGPVPAFLKKYRKESIFEELSTADKDSLRTELLKEQGYICAYCMKRINNYKDTKIEHYQPRNSTNQLQYSTINVQNYFQLISSYKIPVKKEKTLT